MAVSRLVVPVAALAALIVVGPTAVHASSPPTIVRLTGAAACTAPARLAAGGGTQIDAQLRLWRVPTRLLPGLRARGAIAASQQTPAGPATEQGPPNMFEATEGRWGSREIEITDVALIDREGHASFMLASGEPMSIRLRVQAQAPLDDFVFGISLFNAEGVCCYGTNTYLEEMEPQRIEGTVHVTFAIDNLDLIEGTYKLDVAVHKRDGYPYDYHRLLYTFRVKSRAHDVGIYRPRHRWMFEGAVSFRPAARDGH